MYTINEADKAQGKITVVVQYDIGGEYHPLTIKFPDFYPLVPFEILGPTLPPGKHICPTGGALCLMQKPLTNWSVHDNLLYFLQNKVPEIISIHLHSQGDEAKEGTQRSGQYLYAQNGLILTQEWNVAEEYSYGKLIVGIESIRPFRGAVLEVQDDSGLTLAKLDQPFASRYQKKLTARWIRTKTAPELFNEINQLNELETTFPSISKIKIDQNTGVDLIGVIFPEEAGYEEIVENWLFIARKKLKPKNGPVSYPIELIRSDCLDHSLMTSRIKSVSHLRNKKIMIIGMGAIGSVIATQLAKAGINELHLIDYDFVQVGNIPRWILGVTEVGKFKSEVVANFLHTCYPFCKTSFSIHKIGGQDDFKFLELALNDVDLVIDATAEWTVSNLLSTVCRDKNKKYVWATGTQGSRGGVVGRIIPNGTKGCWKCFQHHLNDGSIVSPAADNQPDIQPKGCFHPTFQGTAFDMDNIALAATRLVVSTLNENESTYPSITWDVGILNLWNEEIPVAPQWTEYTLEKHVDCRDHE